jgi:thiamine biosynthesis lipoprotein
MEPITISALGTTWWIEVFDEIAAERRDGLAQSISTLLSSIGTRFSRFRADSLVGQLNTHREVFTNDEDFATLITIGRAMYRQTRGAFNMLTGDELLARGYDHEYSLTRTNRHVAIGNPLVDLDYTDGTWRLDVGQLDLGGIGKGWAIDQVAELLRSEGLQEFLINGGGDMYGTTEYGRPITIYLEHPTEADTYIGTTTIMNQGFAASSSHKRRWVTTAGTTSHIVGDTEMIDASFVIAADAVTADTLATTALLLPPPEFTPLCEAAVAAWATLTLEPLAWYKTPDFPFSPL